MILGGEPREILGYTENYGMDMIAVFFFFNKRKGRHCLRLVNHCILLLLLSLTCVIIDYVLFISVKLSLKEDGHFKTHCYSKDFS